MVRSRSPDSRKSVSPQTVDGNVRESGQDAAMLKRARAITRELEAITGYCEKIAAERRTLLRYLSTDGWSERKMAAGLGISQTAVHKILGKEKGK